MYEKEHNMTSLEERISKKLILTPVIRKPQVDTALF